MRIGQVIGKVTLSRWEQTLQGATWKLVVPFDAEGLADPQKGRGEPFVIYDELGAAEGMIIAIAEGPEATAPFHPIQKAIDGYNAAILDTIEVI